MHRLILDAPTHFLPEMASFPERKPVRFVRGRGRVSGLSLDYHLNLMNQVYGASWRTEPGARKRALQLQWWR
jgi:hypothetical protein